MATKTITIGRKFYQDHRARNCGECGVVLRETKTTVTVLLDEVAWRDLYSDARNYVDMLIYGDDWTDDPAPMRNLCRAAERTLAAMNKAAKP